MTITAAQILDVITVPIEDILVALGVAPLSELQALSQLLPPLVSAIENAIKIKSTESEVDAVVLGGDLATQGALDAKFGDGT